MIEIRPADAKKECRYGAEVSIPEKSPLIGLKLIELENLLRIKVHHYHVYNAVRHGYSHRIFENKAEHKIGARDVIKYFVKDVIFMDELKEEIEDGGDLNQLDFIVKCYHHQTSPSA